MEEVRRGANVATMQTTEILRRGTRRLPSFALSAQRCAALLALAFTACVPRAARGPAASRIAPSRIVVGDFVQVRHASDPSWITSGQIESGAGRSLTLRVARPEPRDTAGSVTRVLSSRLVVVELPWKEVKQLLLPIYVARERGIPYEGGPPPRYQCGLGVCPSNLIVGAGCAAALIAWAASKHDASIFGAVFISPLAGVACTLISHELRRRSSDEPLSSSLADEESWVVVPDAREMLSRARADR